MYAGSSDDRRFNISPRDSGVSGGACARDAKNRLLSRERGKLPANAATIRVQLARQQTKQLNI